MKKPSLKDKLTADKIEAANRLLVEQIQSEKSPSVEVPTEVSPPSVSRAISLNQADKRQEKTNTQPATAKKTVKKAIIEAPADVKLVRVTIDIPENIHEKLKIKMILSKKTIKQYLLDFIEKDLAKSDFKI